MPATLWDDGSWTPLPTLHDDTNAEVCVVGLGGAGLAAIEELLDADVNVIGVDAGGIGGGAAGRNAGFLLGGLADFFPELVARLGRDVATSLYRHTLDEIDRLAARFPADVKITGSLRIAATPEELADCAAHAAALQAAGFAASPYSDAEGTGVLIPTDGVYQPLRCLQRAAMRLVTRGARLFERTPATIVAADRVTTPHARIACDRVIVAVDGRLETVLPELRPRVRTARLQMLSTAPARDVSFPRPVYWRDGFEYWQQLPTCEIALGGFRDRGGESEWTTDAAPSQPVQSLLEKFLRTHLQTTAPVAHRWAANVSFTDDRLPLLEQLRERIWIAGAYSGTGNITSRLTGRAAAALATGKSSAWADALAAARRA